MSFITYTRRYIILICVGTHTHLHTVTCYSGCVHGDDLYTSSLYIFIFIHTYNISGLHGYICPREL